MPLTRPAHDYFWLVALAFCSELVEAPPRSAFNSRLAPSGPTDPLKLTLLMAAQPLSPKTAAARASWAHTERFIIHPFEALKSGVHRFLLPTITSSDVEFDWIENHESRRNFTGARQRWPLAREKETGPPDRK